MKKNPFQKFDRIVVINLKECKNRLQRFRKMAKTYGFKFEVFKAIKHEIGSYGCSLSHLEIIKQAKQDGLNNVLVFEDDAILLYDPNVVYSELEKYFNTQCDVFYLGANLAWSENKAYDNCLGRFAIVYNSSFFDCWIESHPTLEKFKSNRKYRGDALLASMNVKKSGCDLPIVSVISEKSYTGSFAAEIKKPLESGKDHFQLIVGAYCEQNLIDFDKMISELYEKIVFCDPQSQYRDKIFKMTEKLNPFDFIDKILCINLDSDTERWAKMQKIFSEYEIKCNRFQAIKKENGWAGSTLSHRQCILEAKQSNCKNVLIFEDDIFFMYDKNETFEIIRSSLPHLPEKWDILYLGHTPTEMTEKISDDLFRIKKGWGVYAYVVNHTAFDRLLDLFPENEDEITQKDRTVSDIIIYDKILPEGNCYLIPVVASDDGYSHNWKKERTTTRNTILAAYEKYLCY